MKYLKIQNNGLLDIRLVALMGGTTKASDKYKIGQFGTGLKYTLAFLFRNNLDFKIFTGLDLVELKTERETIKDAEFEIICIGGHRTSITTQMGLQWNAWMIIRELWCNALDEGGEKRELFFPDHDSEFVGEENKTTFYIQISPEIEEVLTNWKSYFIHHEEPMFENDEYAIYINNGDNLKLYKQGVLIYQHPRTPSLFKYDIKAANINELREFVGAPSIEVFQALSEPNHETISYFLNNIKENHYEGTELDYGWFVSFASVWRDTIGNRRISKYGDREYYSSYEESVDFKNVIELPKKVYEALVNEFEGIGVLTLSDDKSEFYETPGSPFNSRIEECLATLAECGYQIGADISIKVGIFRDKDKRASANKRNKLIMVSELCQKLNDEAIMSLLIENDTVISNSFDKKSPEFYRHFIDLYTRELLAKNEVVI